MQYSPKQTADPVCQIQAILVTEMEKLILTFIWIVNGPHTTKQSRNKSKVIRSVVRT